MSETNLPGNKAYMRNQMTFKRNSIASEKRDLWSEAACARAQELVVSRGAAAFMIYVAFRSELDLSALMEWGWRTGRTVIAPKCEASDRSMTLYELRGRDELKAGAYGIMEPDPQKAAKVQDAMPAMVFVPGLAFDRNGGRLGYGGGYYDRFAEAIRSAKQEHDETTLWLGMAFEEQLTDEVPLEPHDLRMNGIITENSVYML
ncbi:5-formyltetrahydrofolate cyclo-ligase [Paenibacillus endophyticus]|uniref:5-formyltetrahydrofolate cyclo-ligase n=1 Tax=Paenibacillus endophyticus TaxID=1294268 RepID=A0A7W5GAY5_9BACL|nr:5-formyltetrahydrofolate cyclo-ligase [Paenibacillus endophyticus]MBB3152427.1 5-formyltetrahydrofolate cyclo-ligase [Paenibacillus endophyticus]